MHIGHLRLLRIEGLRFCKALPPDDDLLRSVWQSVDAVKAAAEKPIAQAFAALLDEQARAVLAAWDRVGPGQVEASNQSAAQKRAAEGDAFLGSMVFDVGAWLAATEYTLGPLALAALEEGFASGALRIGQDLSFRMNARAGEALEKSLGLLRDTATTTQNDLGVLIRGALEQGKSADEIGAMIGQRFTDWKSWRAKLVAQTTTTAAFEAGQQAAWTEGGVARNRWLSMRDGIVRAEHDAMDGEEVPIGEAFSNGLEYPQEPNCRCSLLPVGLDSSPDGPSPEGKAAPSDPAPSWYERRNAEIREAYPALKAQHSADMAYVLLGEEKGLQPDTVRKIVHCIGSYAR